MNDSEASQTAAATAPVLQVVGRCDVTIWGLSPSERHGRAFRRAGVSHALPAGETPFGDASVVLVRADYVLAEELVRALVATPGVGLLVEDRPAGRRILVAAHVAAEQAGPAAALLERGDLANDDQAAGDLRLLDPSELGSNFNQMLRKRARPYVLALTERPLGEIERETFNAVYKGATDFVTKWCWPLPARW
ncbi:MAG: CDP-alcohol phosphatidyltransferase family protein, partial [Rhodospirillales bacterium]|nr:CDP-alcohol phosphatidyltransferase family protein [Rhodospirillales bacterium]